MGPRLLLFVIVWCAFSVYVFESHPQPNNRNQPFLEHVKLSCKCNKETRVEIFNVSMSLVWDFYTRKAPCHLENFDSHPELCELLEKCEFCTAEAKQCKFEGVPETDYCRRVTFHLSNMFSHTITESLTDENSVSFRQRRSTNACPHPKKLSNSLLKTTYYHSGLKIIQRCKYGFTLSSGISRVYRCRYDEDVWYPEEFGFEGCQPFIHCEIALKYHGTAKCKSAVIDVPPECHISCPHYEDQPAVKVTSKCDVDGVWKPELPHCATKINGDNLVAPPEIKLHYLEEEVASGLGETKKKLVEEQ